MTQLPERVRQSEFLNQVIIDRTTTEELGRVEVLWMYVPQHRVLGLVGKSGLLGNKKFAFKLSQVQAIGDDGIVTQGEPEATTPDRVKRLESLMQHEVWTEDGERLGKVTDCEFDLKSGKITHYLFVSSGISGILGSIYQVAPQWISSIGDYPSGELRSNRRILLAATATIEPYREGLPQKITKTAETLKEEALQEWRSIAQKAAGQMQQIRSQVQERTHEVSERLREEAQTLAERAKEQSQVLAEQVKEQGQMIGRQIEEGIQTLTVQAEEIFDRSDLPETRQYSYEEADFDWDWDELDEEPSAAPAHPGDSAAASRQSFNTFVDRSSSPQVGRSDAINPDRANEAKANLSEAIDSNSLDDFDFDDDFWSDDPAPVAPKPAPPEPAPEPASPEPASKDSQPFTPETRSPVPPNLEGNSADLDDEPWI